jgi:hypothetical protein
LADIAQREKTPLIYEYDFGDGWEHKVVVEKILAADSEKKCAVCLDGKNARPPEDCGGISGYQAKNAQRSKTVKVWSPSA